MSFFVKATPAPQPKSKQARMASYILAVILAVLAVAQAVRFDLFTTVVGDFWLPIGLVGEHLLAALLITGEIAALPFLLGLRLSVAMRVVSMVMGWLVVAAWLFLQLWSNLTLNVISNNGILGGLVKVPVGWHMVAYVAALGALAAWAAWGQWPLHRRRTNHSAATSKRKRVSNGIH